MSTQSYASRNEELGFFYDTIHGRISLEELPKKFHPTLKAVLTSPALNRLKRISQLGHTSLSYFSATHTRFSHALGTMLVMNKLYLHVANRPSGLPMELQDEVQKAYRGENQELGSVDTFIHCHLLLAALYQDVGELPFQKVTSHYFQPVPNEIGDIQNRLNLAKAATWKTKSVFSVLALVRDSERKDNLGVTLSAYNFDFLVYLITGEGQPPEAPHLGALRQMVDGGIDADRLDYVYRDASVTIGSLSRPTTVLESIIAYNIDFKCEAHVVVSDPRPVVDFLSTRMRLWTFVYTAPDVRFRQALLNTFLQGRLDTPETPVQFQRQGLNPELSFADFLQLDDYSLVANIRECLTDEVIKHGITTGGAGKTLKPFRKIAGKLLLEGTLDYECRILKSPVDPTTAPTNSLTDATLPDELFFDLFRDHDGLQLHNPNGIRVLQTLTENVEPESEGNGVQPISIEVTSGAMSPMFASATSAVLVPKSYFIFRPRLVPATKNWQNVTAAINDGSLYWKLTMMEAQRALACEPDTRAFAHFDQSKVPVSISYCSEDYPSVIRIIQVLYAKKRRFRLFIKPFDGMGDTAEENSRKLISEAKAVLAVVSLEYLKRAQGKGYVNIEVGLMHDRGNDFPLTVVGIDERSVLQGYSGWSWGKMKERWRHENMIVANEAKLKNASNADFEAAVFKALETLGV